METLIKEPDVLYHPTVYGDDKSSSAKGFKSPIDSKSKTSTESSLKSIKSSFTMPDISFDMGPGIMNVLVLLLAASSVTWVPIMVLGGKKKNKIKSVKINKGLLYEHDNNR